MHNVFRFINQISDSFEWSPPGSSILAQGTALGTMVRKWQAESLRHTDLSNTESTRDRGVIYAAGLQPAFQGLPYTQGGALG